MGVMLQSIPYKSQYDADANDFRNDCGPACVAMILNALGRNVTTNTVYRKTGAAANGYVSVGQMMRAARAYNVEFTYFYPWTLNDLMRSLDSGKAVIPLVHYGAWSNLGKTQSSFKGPHFVVVVGYDEEYIYVNDPLWQKTRRNEGEHKRWTHKEFLKAWATASYDGNRNYSGIYCTLPVPVSPANGGEAAEPVEEIPPFIIEPDLLRRILAWATYYHVPVYAIDSQAVLTAFTDAMGDWGLRVEEHIVSSDDTFGLIASHYYNDPMKWEVILAFNGMSSSDTLHDGDILMIPEPLEQPVEIPPVEIPTGGTNNYERAMVETSVKPTRSG